VFLFFDTENSGLSRNFSQILEIALISTDADLNMMSRLHLSCKRLPWDVPSPGALLITGIMPEQLKKEPLTHYQMMRQLADYIHDQHWPVIFAGYNIHGYDHGIVSQNLHQTLHDPFLLTGRKNWRSDANTIFDVLELVRATHIYAPSALKLKTKSASGKYPSMSLGHVCRQNGIQLDEDEAHGAAADTRATIDLARKIKNDVPHIWDQMVKMSNRNNVQSFLEDNEVFAYSQCPYGQAHNVIATRLTDVKDSKTDAVIWDLNVDPLDYLDKTEAELIEIMKLWGEERFKTPLQPLQKHKQPILMPLENADPVWPAGLDQKIIKSRLKTLKEHPEFAQKVAKAAKKARPDFVTGIEPEEKIYKFPDNKIRNAIHEWRHDFHQADWDGKQKLIEDFKTRFAKDIKKDPALERFLQFAKRIIYADAPETLTEARKSQYDKAMHQRRTVEDETVPYMTLPKARAELANIEEQRAEGNPQWSHVTDGQIRALKLFYTALEREFAGDQTPPANNNTDSGPDTKSRSGPKSR